MDRFIREHCEEKGGGLIGSDTRKFSMVLQVKRKLKRAMKPIKTFPEFEAPLWSKDDLITVMESLINAAGIVPYDVICDNIGMSVVNSMIEYNIIHLRPTSSLSDDVPLHENPIITAESPAALVAMKELLREVA